VGSASSVRDSFFSRPLSLENTEDTEKNILFISKKNNNIAKILKSFKFLAYFINL